MSSSGFFVQRALCRAFRAAVHSACPLFWYFLALMFDFLAYILMRRAVFPFLHLLFHLKMLFCWPIFQKCHQMQTKPIRYLSFHRYLFDNWKSRFYHFHWVPHTRCLHSCIDEICSELNLSHSFALALQFNIIFINEIMNVHSRLIK